MYAEFNEIMTKARKLFDGDSAEFDLSLREGPESGQHLNSAHGAIQAATYEVAKKNGVTHNDLAEQVQPLVDERVREAQCRDITARTKKGKANEQQDTSV